MKYTPIEGILRFASPVAKCKTLDRLISKSYTSNKASLINIPLTLLNFINFAVSFPYKSKLVYLTKPEVMQIQATLVEKVEVTLYQVDAAISTRTLYHQVSLKIEIHQTMQV